MEIFFLFILDSLSLPFLSALDELDSPPKIFVAGFVLLTIAIYALMAFHKSVQPVVLLPLLCLGLVSCSTQVMTTPEGVRYVNNNFFSAGTLHVPREGEILMSGTSEKAADALGKHLRTMGMISLTKTGVDAVKDIGVKAVDKLAK